MWFFKTNYKKLAKRKLLDTKQEDVAVFELLEAYLTERIIGGEEFRRNELATLQKKIEEAQRFIKFLKKI